MGTHMKTTIDISDALFREARRLADDRGTTFRAVVESALRKELGAARPPKKQFRLRDVSFRGKGVQPGIDLEDWSQIRSLIYEGRGG